MLALLTLALILHFAFAYCTAGRPPTLRPILAWVTLALLLISWLIFVGKIAPVTFHVP